MELIIKRTFIWLMPKAMSRLQAVPLSYRFAKGAFWSLSGTLISRVLTLLASIIAARFLGKEGFGQLGIIQITVGMFGTFAGFGMGVTAAKHVAEFRKKDAMKAGFIITLSSMVSIISGGILSVLLFVFAPWLAEHTLSAPHLAPLLRLSSCMLLFSSINGAQTGALAGFEAFKLIARINLWVGLLSFPILVGGVYWGGLRGAVIGLIVGLGLNCLMNFYAIRIEARESQIPLKYHGCLSEWRVLWHFSMPAVLSGIMVTPVNWVCNAMLVNQPQGYSEMGIYNAACQWRAAVLFLPGVIGQVLMPMLSERMNQQDNNAAAKMLKLSVAVSAAAVLPIVVGGSLFSPMIMGSYGEGFAGSWSTLVIVLITSALVSAQMPVGNIIAASGKMWLGFLMNSGWGIATIVFTYLQANNGARGIAIGQLIGYLIHAVWTFGYAYKLLYKNKGITCQA
jgi:O-antigen/teichoic acid export membrane protein